MKTSDLCKNYFNGFQEIFSFKNNDAKTNILAALKIFSYFTIVIPLGFAAAASLIGRISKRTHLSPQDQNANVQVKKHVFKNSSQKPDKMAPSKVIEVIKEEHSYTGDLTPLQKSCLKTNFIDDNTLEIHFPHVPTLNVTIRRQNIFNSHAQLVVNAANTHLGGGGGIDGIIHTKGGPKYKEAHQELQKQYKSQYVSGHAALIESGSLKENHNIDNIIVVAGPQGDATPKKESELYSCYYNSLVVAENQNKTSIAFPSISTGIFGFPKDRAASISLKAIFDFINTHPNTKLKNISIHFLPTDPKTNLENYQAATNP